MPFTSLVANPTRNLFFTGKGGVGKTSISCALAVTLADRGQRVLLVSTDPASNLDDVLGTRVTHDPAPIRGCANLTAVNIDPEESARLYRERVVGPYRGVLPEESLASIEEQLSGACTMEIAAFDEFVRLLGDAEIAARYDHIVFDTAPTGHTLLLLDAARSYHREVSRNLGQAPVEISRLLPKLRDPEFTRIFIVTLPEATPVHEAASLQEDLKRAGIEPAAWIINQSLSPLAVHDPLLAARQAGEYRFIVKVQNELATAVYLMP